MPTEDSGIWEVAQKYADEHDRVLGHICGCAICNEFGSLNWNLRPTLKPNVTSPKSVIESENKGV